MSEYAQQTAEAFAQSREYYAELEEWLSGEDAGKLRHAELEEQLQARGRELLRRLHHGDPVATRVALSKSEFLTAFAIGVSRGFRG